MSVSHLEERRRGLEWPPGLGPAAEYRPATFEEYLMSIGLSSRTIDIYCWRFGLVERICGELGVDLLTATAMDLARLAGMVGNTYSMRNQVRVTLRHFYDWQDRTDAPLRAVRVPPNPQMVCKSLEPDEARRLVGVATGWWPEGGAVLLGMYLAMRREEIARSTWERFDGTMAWYRVTGKREKTATLPVHPQVRDQFAPRRATGYIFPGRKGVREHVAPATIWDWTRRVGKAAGIDDLRTHQLRHTALTTALDHTENLRSVMEFARHERPQTTAGYTRTTKEQLLRVSEALDY